MIWGTLDTRSDLERIMRKMNATSERERLDMAARDGAVATCDVCGRPFPKLRPGTKFTCAKCAGEKKIETNAATIKIKNKPVEEEKKTDARILNKPQLNLDL